MDDPLGELEKNVGGKKFLEEVKKFLGVKKKVIKKI